MSKIFTANNLMIVLVAIFITLTGNYSMFSRLAAVYPGGAHAPLLVSFFLFFSMASSMLLVSLCHGKFTRWILALFLIAASMAAFFMDSYGVIIDNVMIQNIIQTDVREAKGLMSVGLLMRVILFGVVPALIVLRFAPSVGAFKKELQSKLRILGLGVLFLALMVAPFYKNYVDFVREHRTVRFYSNPGYFTYSLVVFLKAQLAAVDTKPLEKVAVDAHFESAHGSDQDKKQLIILVVGETARQDRFSLNGYQRPTNPLLEKQSVISFQNVASCGTSTGISVPCMFSTFKRKDFHVEHALHVENALDVLSRNGVKVLWRDNNSDSKGVALRVQYEDFKTPTLNAECDDECRDIGMLRGLDQYIEKNKDHDILIVLHQMGNHGPEYYRRYPDAFKKFQPICRKSRLKECSPEEVDNAYDNAILYTDFFLSSTIDFLKKYDDSHEAAMFYVADHGESLGENNVYLHAAAYNIAPKEQTHIPAILWLGKHFDYQLKDLKKYQNYPLDHGDLFCALLKAFELKAGMCESAFNKPSATPAS